MIELSGGYINGCYQNGHTVEKYYRDDINVGVVVENRIRREALSLKRFDCAPTLHEVSGICTVQEFIEGDVLESADKSDEDFFQAGYLLSQIHTPVRQSFEYTRDYYENRFARHKAQAKPILESEGLDPSFEPIWDKVAELGTTRLHRDFWLGNVIRTKNLEYKAIDWELAGIGSPYEDFAIADLWIFRKHGGKEFFYEGYGKDPDPDIAREFLRAKLVHFIALTSFEEYEQEEQDGFYHNKVRTLQELVCN